MTKKNLDWNFEGKIIEPKNLYFDTSKMYDKLLPKIDMPKITPVSSIVEGVERKQEVQIKIANEHLIELQKANDNLQKEIELLVNQNDELKKQAIDNAKEKKKQKVWNWFTFIVSALIGVASVVIAIVLR